MRAVILAAGEGLRMRPLTENKPKPMVEILGKPLLHHIFDSLPDEIGEVILVTGYLEKKIKEYFGENFAGKKIGTAQALWLARSLLADERFLMLYADNLQSKADIQKCLEHPLSIMVKEVEDPRRFGVIVADDRGKVLDLVEKPISPPSNLASTGVKVLDSKIFNYPAKQHPNGEYYITDSLAQMVRDYEMIAVRADFWLPIGYPEDIKKTEEILRARQIKEI